MLNNIVEFHKSKATDISPLNYLFHCNETIANPSTNLQ